MRAELLVEVQMSALAEQMQIEVGEDGWKAIRILELDLAAGVARAHAIAARRVRRSTLEQACFMDAFEVAFATLLVDDRGAFGLREKDPHDRRVAFLVRAEITEGVGVATLDHGMCFRRKRTHAGEPSGRLRIRSVPRSGTRSQSGRCASS